MPDTGIEILGGKLVQSVAVEKYDYIDALRGFAILGVVLVHTSQWVSPSAGIPALIAKNGARGVQLFFLASALTLFLSIEKRREHESRSVIKFFIRRFFRIAPLFYLAIIAFTLYSGMSERYWAPDGISWWHIALTATFLHGWHPETITSVVPGGWSIAVEMTFYLFVPYLFLKLKDVRSTVIALLASLVFVRISSKLATIVLSSMYPESQQYLVSGFTFLWFFSQLPIFLLGILTYHVIRAHPNQDKVLSAAFLCVSFFLAAAFLQASTFQTLLPQHFMYGVVFAFFALALHFDPESMFVNRVTTLIGRLSFSIYIVHFMILNLLKEVFDNGFPMMGTSGFALAYLLVLGLSMGLSSILYRAVEIPGINLGKRVIATLEQSTSAEAPLRGVSPTTSG